MQIVPLCILISRDGIRSYLYGVRRKTLLCFELSQIHILQSLDKKPLVNRDGYMEKIRKSWDIDIHEPVQILKLKVSFRIIWEREQKKLRTEFYSKVTLSVLMILRDG